MASFTVSVFSTHLTLHEVAPMCLRTLSCHSNISLTGLRKERTSGKDENDPCWNDIFTAVLVKHLRLLNVTCGLIKCIWYFILLVLWWCKWWRYDSWLWFILFTCGCLSVCFCVHIVGLCLCMLSAVHKEGFLSTSCLLSHLSIIY